MLCENRDTERRWACEYGGRDWSDAAAAKSLQSCLTLCDPIDGGPPGSPVPGILQARTLEWVAISFSNAWKWKVKEKSLSHVRLFATPWTAAHQAPPSMGSSRQEYWSGVPLPSPWSDATGNQRRPGAIRRNGERKWLSSRGPGVVWPCQHLVFGILASRTVTEDTDIVWATQFEIICYRKSI